MAGLYDLTLLLDPDVPVERRDAVISETEGMITQGGEIVESHDWGQRRMAYEIDHRAEAEYRIYGIRADNTVLDRLNQRLRILDGVLRYRIIKRKEGQPMPPPPDQQALRRRDERDQQDTRVAARAAADAPPAPADAAPAATGTPPAPVDAPPDPAGAPPAAAESQPAAADAPPPAATEAPAPADTPPAE
jgi:small subunit ribosomal protein S6